MRDIETILNDLEANGASRKAILDEKTARIEAFKKALDDEFRQTLGDLSKLNDHLQQELRVARAATASHPLEGKSVEREELRRSRSYFYGKDKNVTIRGVIKVVRSWDDLPRETRQNRGQRQPEFGEAFVQRVNAKGEELADWVLLTNDGGLPYGWKLVEEIAA